MDHLDAQNGSHFNKMATKMVGIVLIECNANYTVLLLVGGFFFFSLGTCIIAFENDL